MPEGSTPQRRSPAALSLDAALEEAQQALAGRPRRSARVAIAGAFGLAFLLVFALTIAGMVLLASLRQRIRYLEDAGDFESALLEARRFEKNYLFLGAGNPSDATEALDEALEHLHRARGIAESVADRRGDSKIAATWRSSLRNLDAYRSLLAGLPGRAARDDATIREIREAGRRVLHDATVALAGERHSLDVLLDRAFLAGVLFLVLTLVIMGLLAIALILRVIRPINRFVAYTQRIAGGDFSPIAPARRYRDEFSNLALAFNVMLGELGERQESLVRAGRLAALGTLTSGIAHELNNPLNNISLTVEALSEDLEELPPEKIRKLVDDVFTQLKRASGTVRNLLDFTRSERPVFVSARIPGIVETVIRLVGNEADLNHVRVITDLPEDLPPIRACPRSLEQVLLNLCLNAIQACPDGGELRIRARRVNGDQVRIDVADDGSGIAPEDLQRIFDPFFTTKEVGVGTGLGLTVTHRLVEDHGGRIEVSSEPGTGTTFSVFLDLEGPPRRPDEPS